VIKILDFMRGFLHNDSVDVETTGPILSTEKMQSISETLRKLPPIGNEDAKAWVGYWKSKGLFD
jgi:hypothetical protein